MADTSVALAAGKRLLTLEGSLSAGALYQMSDGSAGSYSEFSSARIAGQTAIFDTNQKTEVMPKTAGFVALAGNRAYWDHSANSVYYKRVSDRDFYIGRFSADALSAATECSVIKDVDPAYDRELIRDASNTILVGTPVINAFGNPKQFGGALVYELDSQSEAQKVDALGIEGWATGANAIIEGAFRVISDGSGSEPDISIGIANGTNATDADTITESCFIHLNGNDVNIYAESDDGTVEVNATDTTVDYSEGSALTNRVEFWMDMRNPADIQIYINGNLILAATVFNVSLAAGPWYLLVHAEKTSSASTYKLAIDWLRARFMEQ